MPFYGGTYFPLEARYGRPGFLQVLQTLRRFFEDEGDKIQSVKAQILDGLRQSVMAQVDTVIDGSLLRLGLECSAGVLSAQTAGPRFPMIPYADAALRGARFHYPDARYDALDVCQRRGLDLALGGIYDHVAGGFHRYTVDPSWTVPHFEKMLYDNGQIMEYLANLWSTGMLEPAFERAIAGTVQWLKREMIAPAGFFYAAQDADSFAMAEDVEPEEGAFYVWRYSELEALLSPDDLAELTEQFAIAPAGNFEGQIVLQRQNPGRLPEPVEQSLDKLFRVRYGDNAAAIAQFPPALNNEFAKRHPWAGRIPAVTDTKMIVAWNSLMISGLARAAAVFQRVDYFDLASAAAEFILGHQWKNGRFHRLNYDGQAVVLAQSEDYALFIKALLDLDQAAHGLDTSAAIAWVERAIKVQEEFDEYLWSVELGGYYNTDARGDLVVRERSLEDSATPSANGVAIANLVRIALLSNELDYLDRAEQALASFSGIMRHHPQSCPSLFAALDWFQTHTLIRTDPSVMARLTAKHFPTVVLSEDCDLPDDVVGLVCQGLSCNEPSYSWEQLEAQLWDSQTRDLLS